MKISSPLGPTGAIALSQSVGEVRVVEREGFLLADLPKPRTIILLQVLPTFTLASAIATDSEKDTVVPFPYKFPPERARVHNLDNISPSEALTPPA